MGPSTQWVDFSRSPTCACTTLLTYGNAEHDSGPAPCKTAARDECGHPRCAESSLVMNAFGLCAEVSGPERWPNWTFSCRDLGQVTKPARIIHHERRFCTRNTLAFITSARFAQEVASGGGLTPSLRAPQARPPPSPGQTTAREVPCASGFPSPRGLGGAVPGSPPSRPRIPRRGRCCPGCRL